MMHEISYSLPPGQQECMRLHSHPHDMISTTLQGELTYVFYDEDGEETEQVVTSPTSNREIHVAAGRIHTTENTGDVPVTLTVASITGPYVFEYVDGEGGDTQTP